MFSCLYICFYLLIFRAGASTIELLGNLKRIFDKLNYSEISNHFHRFTFKIASMSVKIAVKTFT